MFENAKSTLRDHGDGPERMHSDFLSAYFPNYELFWRRHIVPLTFRQLTSGEVRWVRPGVRSELRQLAATHYGTFLRLAMAEDVSRDPRSRFHACEFSTFYFHLHGSFNSLLKQFLYATRHVLKAFAKPDVCPPPKHVERMKEHWGDHQLYDDYKALNDEVRAYRNCTAHNPTIILVDGKVPKWQLLPRRPDEEDLEGYFEFGNSVDLAQITAISDQAKLDADYLPAAALVPGHLLRCTSILNRIWQHVIEDLRPIEGKQVYIQAQNVPLNRLDRDFLAWHSTHVGPEQKNPAPGRVGPQGPL